MNTSDRLTLICEAADRFNTATASENEWRQKMSDLDLDRRIAEREGDETKLAEATAAVNAARTEWYGYYQACQDSSKGLCRALGVDPRALRSALPS